MKSTISSFGAAIASRFGQLALGILLARQFGASDYGIFTFALGVAALGATIATMGWGNVMLRFIPSFTREQDWSKLKGLRNAGDFVVLAGSLAVAAIAIAIGFFSDRLAYGLLLGAVLLVPLTFAHLRKVQLAAVRRPGAGLMLDQGFGALLTLFALLIWGLSGPGSAVIHYALATVVAVTISTLMFRRGLPSEVRTAKAVMEIGTWHRIAFPSMVGHSAKLLMNRMDVLLLAPLSTMAQVGLFGAAFRLTYILTFPQLVLMAAMWPLLSEALSAGNGKRLRSLHRKILLFTAVTSLPLTTLIVLFPTQILVAILGPEFAAAAPTLVALALGQQASSFAISYSAILGLGGREKAFGAVNLAALGINVVLNLALIPSYGAFGSAVGTAVSSVLLLIAQVVLSARILADPKAVAGGAKRNTMPE